MNVNKYKIYLIIIICQLMTNGCEASPKKKRFRRGIMDNVNVGLKFAGQMFGINTASDVANLVARAFSTRPNNSNDMNKNGKNQEKFNLFSLLQPNRKPSEESREQHQQNSESGEHRNEYSQKQSTAAPSSNNFDLNFATPNFLVGMMRILGFDANKLGAMAINAMVLIATALAKTLMSTYSPQPQNPLDKERLFAETTPESADNGPEEKYSPNDYQPRSLSENDEMSLNLFLKNPSKKLKFLLGKATDKRLVDELTTMISNYENEKSDDGGCIKMLICKISQFIWGMQKSVRGTIEPIIGEKLSNTTMENESNVKEKRKVNRASETENIRPSAERNNGEGASGAFNMNVFYKDFPSFKEFREHSKKCDELYAKYCSIKELLKDNV